MAESARIPTIASVIPNNWDTVLRFNRDVQKYLQALSKSDQTLYLSELFLTSTTASRLLATDASQEVGSTDLASWVTGTANEINITDDGDGTVTIGLVDPLIVAKGGSGAATFTDHSILLGSGTDAFTALGSATNGQLPIGSTGADPVLATLTGTANQITVTNGAGSITLSTPQDIATGSSPTFDDLTLSNPSNIYALSHDSFADFVANEHIDHTSVTLTAGTGLTGGGDISTNRTFAVDGVLEDLDTLGAASSDGEFIVATGAGVFAYESGDTARVSLGVGTTNSPTFAGLTLTGSPGTIATIGTTGTGSNTTILYRSEKYTILDMYSYNDGAGESPEIHLSKSRGSISSPTTTADNDYLGFLVFEGYDGTAFENGAGIAARVDGSVSTDDVPTELTFWSRPSGASTFRYVGRFAADGILYPEYGIKDTTLTATRLMASDGSKQYTSTDLASWVSGTANQITVTDDSDGTITLSTPQNIHTSATPQFSKLSLGAAYVSTGCHLDVTGTIRAMGDSGPTTGAGIEFAYTGGVGYMFSYDRDATTYKPFVMRGSDVELRIGSTKVLHINSSFSTQIGDGGTTNYAQFASDGTLTLVGTARVTKEFELTSEDFAPGATGATETLLGNYDGWAFGISDDMVSSFEIPHDWDSSTNLSLYVYWYINEAYATNSGEVQWRIQWSACPVDGTEAIDAPTHTGTIDFGDQNIPATAKYLTKTSAGTIAAASLSAGDLVGITLDRVALDDGSNPTAEPVMVHMEVEYTSNKLGEAL